MNYISTIPVDPFENKFAEASGTIGVDMYEVAVAPREPEPIKKMYNINSRGPDQDEDMGQRSNLDFSATVTSYTPTNGLISNGDIYMFGGDASVMKWYLYIDGDKYLRTYPSTPRF